MIFARIYNPEGKISGISPQGFYFPLTRLFVIAKSDRNIDLMEAISNYEFSNVNTRLMNLDGTVLQMQAE